MSRKTVVVCDLCGHEQALPPGTVPPVAWAGVDACPSCLNSTRLVREVLEAVARASTTLVSPADLVPERTRPRRTSA
jgi:hypothetical protein